MNNLKYKFLKGLKNIILYCFCKWYRQGNRIIVHKENNVTNEIFYYFGISIKFKGKNSVVHIYEPIEFKRRLFSNKSFIIIRGDNNYVLINSNSYIYNMQINGINSNCELIIGKNFYQQGVCSVDFCGLDNISLEIGQNCMFGQETKFMLGDHHSIYNIDTNECINIPKKGISIGNHVWLARGVQIMKNVTILDGCIIGASSLVTKEFNEKNCIIAGCPAKIVKRNIRWGNENTK